MPAPYSTSDKTSFAYISARDRWPVILVHLGHDRSERFTDAPQTGAIDDVYRAVADATDGPKQTEGKKIIADLAKLKYELQHDRKLT